MARFGRLVEKRPGDQQGIFYAPLVNTVRGEIPGNVPMIEAKVTALKTGADRQTVTLSTGEEISARLIVLANGLNVGLRDSLGITREILSECHSISIGFDVKPVGRRAFDFPALTYYAESAGDKTALITMFPIGAAMRANLFIYRDMKDPWLRELRAKPQETLFALMPGLRKLMGDFEVDGFIKIRPVDLYVTHGYCQPGVVLVGDAFSTSCPAAGTGARKAMMDAERLCHGYIPQWLATPGMGPARSPPFTPIPRSVPATTSAATRPMACVRSRPIRRSPGARAAGSSSSGNMRAAPCGNGSGRWCRHRSFRVQNEEPAMPATADTRPRVLSSSGGRDQVVRRLAARDLSDVA